MVKIMTISIFYFVNFFSVFFSPYICMTHSFDIIFCYLFSAVVEIQQHVISKADLRNLGHAEKVDNMVMLFEMFLLMHDEKKRTGMIRRVCFNPMFAVCSSIRTSFSISL